jgi:hypothetical protein
MVLKSLVHPKEIQESVIEWVGRPDVDWHVIDDYKSTKQPTWPGRHRVEELFCDHCLQCVQERLLCEFFSFTHSWIMPRTSSAVAGSLHSVPPVTSDMTFLHER